MRVFGEQRNGGNVANDKNMKQKKKNLRLNADEGKMLVTWKKLNRRCATRTEWGSETYSIDGIRMDSRRIDV